MDEQCLNLLQRACHEEIWSQYESTISLTLSLWEIFQILVALLVLLLIRNFLADSIKRDVLLGYIPTLIIFLKDNNTGKIVLARKHFTEKEDNKPSPVWHMPQGVMESPDLRVEARRILKETLNLDEHEARLTYKHISLDRRLVPGIDKEISSTLGFTFFKHGRGRVYKVIYAETEVNIEDGKLSAFGEEIDSAQIDGVGLYEPKEALELIKETYAPYARRKDKIQVYERILTEFGYLQPDDSLAEV